MKATFKLHRTLGQIIDWTPALDAFIVNLWGRKYTSRRIAEEIGLADARNAVIGRLHRLGIIRKKKVFRIKQPKIKQAVNYNQETAARLVDAFGALHVRKNPQPQPDKAIRPEDC